MSKIADATFKGESGAAYSFQVYLGALNLRLSVAFMRLPNAK
jgi:hypothetical protein